MKIRVIFALFLIAAHAEAQAADNATTLTASTTTTTAPTTTTTVATTTTTTTPSAFGTLTISISPSNWVNYSDNAVVNFTFSPPCPGVSLYLTTALGRTDCVLGPACQQSVTFAGMQTQFDPAGAWIKVQNASTQINGYYYGTCPPPVLRQYRTVSAAGDSAFNLMIGVNPKVLRFMAQQGIYSTSSYNFTRSRGANGQLDQFGYFGGISLSSYDYLNLVFGVGRGLNPLSGSTSVDYLTVTNSNFSFTVPDFDSPTGNYSFVKKTSTTTSVMSDVSPTGQYYSYQLTRSDAAKNKICSIQGTAVAVLRGAAYQDTVMFNVGLIYSMTIGSISIDRGSNVSGSCSCLFTCNANACPTATPTKYEWAFYDNSTTYISSVVFMAGNVPGRPDQYQLSPADCQTKFGLSRLAQTSYQITCRVYGGTNNSPWGASLPASTFQTPLWSLLRPCNPNEYQCVNSKECIVGSFRCNGKRDCIDGSDETGCVVGPCALGQFNCPTSKECIPFYKLCDGISDCIDNADEQNCTKQSTPCAIGYFKCDNGRCTRGRYNCDGDNDCGDSSDERRCGSYSSGSRCSSGQFVCNNGNCISKSYVCDGINNCVDNSDEYNCGTYYSATCGTDDWQCANGNCVISSDLCDGANDCEDNSDERVCTAGGFIYNGFLTTPQPGFSNSSVIGSICNVVTQFQCANGRCEVLSNLCDGDNDCGDYSDESAAVCSTCPNGRFHCRNNKCVSQSYVCDRDDDCGDRSDEDPNICSQCSAAMNMWQCKGPSKRCISMTRLCDMSRDCGVGDDSDETPDACAQAQSVAALKTTCPAGTVKCGTTSQCIPQSSLCNGISDCCPRTSSSYLYSYSSYVSENETHYGNCEKTDEIGCDRNANCVVGNGGCQTRCLSIILPAEPSVCGGLTSPGQAVYCACDPGYARPPNNTKVCIDINECQASPFANNCSQSCTNLPGSFMCSCQNGFVDKGVAAGGNASGLCVVNPLTGQSNDAMVFLIDGDTIRMWNKTARTLSVIDTTSLDKPYSALVVDFRDQTVIFAQAGASTLRRTTIPINGQQPKPLNLANPIPYDLVVDMTVDFIGGNLYVADVDFRQQSRVIVSLLDGRYQKTIVRSSIQVTSIAVNPLLGRLYYATYSTGASLYSYSSYRSALIMTSMNGSQYTNTEIYSAATSYIIKSIAVDFLGNGRIYFYNGYSIVLANADGSGNATFTMAIYSAVDRPFDVFGNFLFGLFTTTSYASADYAHMLYEVDKFSRAVATNVTGSLVGASFVRVHHDLKAGNRANWPNPCAPLKCSHLCLLNMEKGASCACPDGQDQTTCTSTKVDPPQHPADCYRTCIQGQGVCVNDPNRNTVVCLCNRLFLGPTCNETVQPEIRYVTIPDLQPVTSSTPAPTTTSTQPATASVTAAAAQNLAGSSSPSSDSSSGGDSRSLLVALIVVAVILLVLILVGAGVGGYYWYRKRQAGNANFNMSQLQEDRHVEGISNPAAENDRY